MRTLLLIWLAVLLMAAPCFAVEVKDAEGEPFDLGRQEITLEQSPVGLPEGYELNADGSITVPKVKAADLSTIVYSTGTTKTCFTTWKPQPDITVHELALIVPVLAGRKNNDFMACCEVSCLPKEARRHFDETCQ